MEVTTMENIDKHSNQSPLNPSEAWCFEENSIWKAVQQIVC